MIDTTVTTHITPEMKFYDRVVILLRERGITQTPVWEEVMNGMKGNLVPEEVALQFVADWDVD